MRLLEEPLTKRYTYTELITMCETNKILNVPVIEKLTEQIKLFARENLILIRLYKPFNSEKYILLSGGEFLTPTCKNLINKEIKTEIYYSLNNDLDAVYDLINTLYPATKLIPRECIA